LWQSTRRGGVPRPLQHTSFSSPVPLRPYPQRMLRLIFLKSSIIRCNALQKCNAPLRNLRKGDGNDYTPRGLSDPLDRQPPGGFLHRARSSPNAALLFLEKPDQLGATHFKSAMHLCETCAHDLHTGEAFVARFDCCSLAHKCFAPTSKGQKHHVEQTTCFSTR